MASQLSRPAALAPLKTAICRESASRDETLSRSARTCSGNSQPSSPLSPSSPLRTPYCVPISPRLPRSPRFNGDASSSRLDAFRGLRGMNTVGARAQSAGPVTSYRRTSSPPAMCSSARSPRYLSNSSPIAGSGSSQFSPLAKPILTIQRSQALRGKAGLGPSIVLEMPAPTIGDHGSRVPCDAAGLLTSRTTRRAYSEPPSPVGAPPSPERQAQPPQPSQVARNARSLNSAPASRLSAKQFSAQGSASARASSAHPPSVSQRRRLAAMYIDTKSQAVLDLSATTDVPPRSQYISPSMSDAEIMDLLREVQLFRSLSDTDLRMILRRAQRRYFPRYSTIIREGHSGVNFYVLLEGCVVSTSALTGVEMLRPGAAFGETGLAGDLRREASVEAVQPSHVLQLTLADLDEIESPLELDGIRRLVITRGLESVSFFSSLQREQRERLAEIMEVQYASSQEYLFHEGDAADSMYIVIEGFVSCFMADFGDEPIAEFHPRSDRPWFGELAMTGKAPRSQTARAREPSKLFVVRRPDFVLFLEICPQLEVLLQQESKALASINKLREKAANMKAAALTTRRSSVFDVTQGAIFDRSTQNEVERRWEKVVSGLLALVAQDQEELRVKIAAAGKRASLVVETL